MKAASLLPARARSRGAEPQRGRDPYAASASSVVEPPLQAAKDNTSTTLEPTAARGPLEPYAGNRPIGRCASGRPAETLPPHLFALVASIRSATNATGSLILRSIRWTGSENRRATRSSSKRNGWRPLARGGLGAESRRGVRRRTGRLRPVASRRFERSPCGRQVHASIERRRPETAAMLFMTPPPEAA